MLENYTLGSAPASEPITLLKNIAAIQIHAAQNGREQLGFISQLPRGAELHFCGCGFSDRTLKVSWRGQYYFVFLQDVEQPEGSASEHW